MTLLVGSEASIADVAIDALTSYAPDIAIDLQNDFPAIAACTFAFAVSADLPRPANC